MTGKRVTGYSVRRGPVDVSVCVIRDGTRFLIARRREGNRFGGYWEFPGGKRRPGEDLEGCALREAREEVGLDLVVERKLRTMHRPYTDDPVSLHFFMCRVNEKHSPRKGNHPKRLSRGRDRQCRWVDVHELTAYAFPPANEPILSYLVETFAHSPPR